MIGYAIARAASRAYLPALRSETRSLAAQGTAVDENVGTLETAFRERYPDWDASEWIAFGVRCFHAEHGRE